MQALILLEARNVIEAALTGIVWQMQADSPIYANHDRFSCPFYVTKSIYP